MAFGGGGARLTPIFFYSAAAAGTAAPIGLNENKPKNLSVHGTICAYNMYISVIFEIVQKMLQNIRCDQRLGTPNYSSK
jgi:hypothetical protein